MSSIASVRAWEILDSRGNPTVRAEVRTDSGHVGVAAVPSGASTGVHEALELRDGDAKRYGGKGVRKAVANVNGPIARAVVGHAVHAQGELDQIMRELDGTPNKSTLGANAVLAVSLAAARAAALAAGLPLYRYLRGVAQIASDEFRLPVPMMNILNGGRHADSGLSIQEFMVIPKHRKFSERLRMGTEVFHVLHDILRKRDFATTVGDEGGFAPRLGDNERALRVILEAIRKAGYTPGRDIALGLDVAASEFYTTPEADASSSNGSGKGTRGGRYFFKDAATPWTPVQMMACMERWARKYPLISIEDPLAEDDWDHWTQLTSRIGKRVQLVGDDLFVTNVERLERGIAEHVGNAILIKVNQIGSLSETLAAITRARAAKYRVIISHRSGETADTFIADLAVAVNAEYIKTGSLSRSERVEKYNRLLEIESEVRADR
ncbi:phosphopyruvate hydratase [Candidatus Uhrbacteria bacterium]|nr:phosphopyruvate hydratase [Candidatus Uhrbacteria bacterium]